MNLTFRGPCIVSTRIIRCISNKMQLYTVFLSLETALHVSGGISTHHQEHIQLYLQYLVLVQPLLPPATIVEELDLLCVWCYCHLPLSWKSWNWFECSVGNVLICFGAFASATAPKQTNTFPTLHSNQFQLFHNSGR